MNKISNLTMCGHWFSSTAKHGLNIPIDPTVALICVVCKEEARSWTRKPKAVRKYHKVPCQDCQRLIWRVKTSLDGVCNKCNQIRRRSSPKRHYKGLCSNSCGKRRIEGSAFCSDKCRHQEHAKAELYFRNKGY